MDTGFKKQKEDQALLHRNFADCMQLCRSAEGRKDDRGTRSPRGVPDTALTLFVKARDRAACSSDAGVRVFPAISAERVTNEVSSHAFLIQVPSAHGAFVFLDLVATSGKWSDPCVCAANA